VEVIILKAGKRTSESKFPTPIAVYRPNESWRSRWNKPINTLEYNSGHYDYLIAKDKSKKAYLRYLGFLFSKHLVLHNFGNVGEDSILERMIEVITRLENRLWSVVWGSTKARAVQEPPAQRIVDSWRSRVAQKKSQHLTLIPLSLRIRC